VTHAFTCSFTNSNSDDLVRATGDRLLVGPRDQPIEIGVNGRIGAVASFSPRSGSLDRLAVLTEKLHLAVLLFEPHSCTVETVSSGDVSDPVGQRNYPLLLDIDPNARFAAACMSKGLAKIMPIAEDGSFIDAYNIRLSELEVLGLRFLPPLSTAATSDAPTLAVLHEDSNLYRPVRLYEVLLSERDVREGAACLANADDSEHVMPAPHPCDGLLIVGECRITHVSESALAQATVKTSDRANGTIAAPPPSSSSSRDGTVVTARTPCMHVCSAGQADSSGIRFLISDIEGLLVLITIQQSAESSKQVQSLQVTVLGHATPARALASLGDGRVFLGSLYGDNQLVSISDTSTSEQGRMVTLEESYSSLAPIQDLVMVDIEKQGQGQAITCSGNFNHGSLRIVRNGIGVNVLATLAELEGAKGIFSLRQLTHSSHHSHLAISFISETKILAMDEDEELAEAELNGLDTNVSTIAMQTVANDLAAQVSASSVNLFSSHRGGSLDRWSASSRISVASISGSQVLLGTGAPALVLLDVSNECISESKSCTLASEASCVDCTPLQTGALSFQESESSTASGVPIAAVGFWDNSVALYSLPGLQLLTSVSIEQDSVPRSVLLRDFESVAYLLVGLGDGNLLTYPLLLGGDTSGSSSSLEIALGQRKRVSLGTQPLRLTPLTTKGMRSALVSSDRPTLVHSSSGKLLFSNVTLPEVSYVCPFNHESVFPDSLALVGSNSLTIGNINEIQRLHIRTIPLHEHPRRIAHQEETRTLCVLTQRTTANPEEKPAATSNGSRLMETDNNKAADEDGDERADMQEGFVRLFDDQTYELISSFQLDRNEHPFSLISCQLGDSNASSPRFVAGTVFVESGEEESGRGRILVFSVLEGKHLRLEHALDADGEVFSLAPFDKMLLVGASGRVDLYSVTDVGGMQRLCSHEGNTNVMSLRARGGFVAVGDMMRSVTLLLYDSEKPAFEERAQDFNPSWLTCVSMLDDDNVLAAENNFNLFTVHKNSDAATDEERMRLEVTGEYHLGDLVTSIREGSLTMDLPDSEVAGLQTTIFATVGGALGVIAQVSKQQFDFLFSVQDAMREKMRSVGNLSHAHYRGFMRDRDYEKDSRGFVDGDFVETYLELPRSKQEEIADRASLNADDIAHRLEDFSRLH